MARCCWSVVLLCMLLAPRDDSHGGNLASHSEAAVKAVFVFRFAGYVEWPRDRMSGEDFTIAVLGAPEVARHLRHATANRSILGRPVRVRAIDEPRDLGGAQVLYVGSERRGPLRPLLAPLAGSGVLLISEDEQGLAAGSTINLMTADRRVRFEISQAAARRARLKISSELLALAVRVLDPPEAAARPEQVPR